MSAVTQDHAIVRGQEALTFFHNYAVIKFKSNYGFSSRQALFDYLNLIRPALIEAYGRLLLQNQVDDTALSGFMKKLVDAGKGRLPEKLSVFYNVIEPKSWGSFDTIKFVASETASQAVDGAAKIGDAGLGALKLGLNIAPIVLAAAVLLYVGLRAKTI